MVLHLPDVSEKHFVGEFDVGIPVAGIFFFIDDGARHLAKVAAIGCGVVRGLTSKHLYGILHRIGLILLYLEVEFHGLQYLSNRILTISIENLLEIVGHVVGA